MPEGGEINRGIIIDRHDKRSYQNGKQNLYQRCIERHLGTERSGCDYSGSACRHPETGKDQIGDTINVKTNKCYSVDEGMSGKSGVWRKGTVIGIFRNFVHVRLQSGVCESVLWADIMNSSMEDDDEEE